MFRLFTSLFVPSTPWTGLVSIAVLSTLRDVERYMGPGRFGAFVLLTTLLTQPMSLAALVMFPGLKSIEGGPMAVAAAMLTLFQRA